MASSIHFYQELSKLFLGLQLSEVKDTLDKFERPATLEALESAISETHYYQLDKNDSDFGNRFKFNLKLARRKDDHDYIEYLESLLLAVNPVVGEKTDLKSPTLELDQLVIKRKPKIISKPKIIAKTGAANKKNVDYINHQAQLYQVSDSLKKLLPKFGLEVADQVDIPTIKQAVNNYINQKDLQIILNKTHFKLDESLKKLFPNYQYDTMSYAKLKIELKHHLTGVK